MKRNCDNCGKSYEADARNIKRGWGLTCSKSCAASKREKSKPNYNPDRVERNNFRRANWNSMLPNGLGLDENYYGVFTGKRTSEGYKIYKSDDLYTAVDEFGKAIYTVDIYDDTHAFSEDAFN